MRRCKSILLSLPLLFSFLSSKCLANSDQEPYLDAVTSIPECGLECVLRLTPGINSSCISDPTTTCLCENNISNYINILKCVQGRCTIEESIETARGAWQECGKPKRSRKHDMLGSLAVEGPALICVLLRLFSRWWTLSRFEVDDYIMMGVAVLYLAFEVLGSIAAQLAFGVDIWTVDSADLSLSIKFFYACETLYLIILTLTKISILCFYLRIFANRTFRVCSFVTMAWVVVSGVIFVFLQLFQCVPVQFIWEGWKKGSFGSYHCLDVNALAFTTATFSIAQDVVIIILPLPLLAKLDVSLRSKLGIVFMFSLGIFVTITSSVRLWTILSFGDSVNPTWDYTNVLIWTGLEVAVSIIVTSLPAIRVLLSHCFPGTFGSPPTSRRRGYTSTSSFGNDTYVASWHSAPPALKRLSAISRISSIFVEGLGRDDYVFGKEESHIELDDKLTGAGAERHSCPPDLPRESAGSPINATGLMPNIAGVLSTESGTERGRGRQLEPQIPRRTATVTSAGSTVIGSDSPVGSRP